MGTFLFSTMWRVLCVAVLLVVATDALDAQCIAIYGYSSCAYFRRAECWGKALPKDKYTVAVVGGTRAEYHEHLKRLKGLHGTIEPGHRTSPMVLRGCEYPQFVGGSDDFVAMLKKEGIDTPQGCW